MASGDRAVHLVVNLMGRVRSCSPGNTVPGYRAC
jgi:type IV fimbrial biogenesis protein FimT